MITKFDKYNNTNIILYHGTCLDNAKYLLKNGWNPNLYKSGSNQGQSKYLYLTSKYEDALWFAEEKGCDIVLSVTVDIKDLLFDPEDGDADVYDYKIENAIKKINNNYIMPIKFVIYKPLSKNNFRK